MKVHGMRFALMVIAALIIVPAAFAKPTSSSPFFPGGRQYADDLHARSTVPINKQAPVLGPPKNYGLVDTPAGRDVSPLSVAMSSEPSGFDWSDAGIGAGGVLGLMVLGGGVLAVTRLGRRRRLALL